MNKNLLNTIDSEVTICNEIRIDAEKKEKALLKKIARKSIAGLTIDDKTKGDNELFLAVYATVLSSNISDEDLKSLILYRKVNKANVDRIQELEKISTQYKL